MINLREESGIYLIIFSLFLLLLLMLGALAVDVGWMATRLNFLQRASDAGSLSGMHYRINIGWKEADKLCPNTLPPRTIDNLCPIEQVALDSTIQNLNLLGVSGAEATVTAVRYDSFEDTVTVRIGFPAKFMFAHGVPGLVDGQLSGDTLNANSVVRLNPAVVSLILDTSGSMICTDGETEAECKAKDCFNNPDIMNTPACTITKIDILADAVRTFIGMFNPHRDKINLVRYSTRADLTLTLDLDLSERQNGGFDANDFETAIGNLRTNAIGATNMCDALMTSFSDMEMLAEIDIDSLPIDQQANARLLQRSANYVFFTDGAPSAARFQFAPSAVQGSNLPANPADGRFDYIMYALESIDIDENRTIVGSQLIPTFNVDGDPSIDPYNQLLRPVEFYAPEIVPQCSRPGVPDDAANYEAAMNTLIINNQDGSNTLGTCLNNLGFIPLAGDLDSNGPGDGYNFCANNPAEETEADCTFDPDGWKKQMYHCAISAADGIRLGGGFDTTRIYAIGLGADANPAVSDDPYQGVRDDFVRKDNFLSRLAFDPISMALVSNPPPPFGDGESFEYDRSGAAPPYLTNPDEFPQLHGLYYPTSNPEELNAIFSDIARQILLRMVVSTPGLGPNPN